MNVQVLVAAMHQQNHNLLDKMNIQSDVIVGNQCDRNAIETFKYHEYEAIYLNFNERGVGLNRNNALMRATGDICLFADDDMVYVDGYVDIVRHAFRLYPDADVIIFNLIEEIPKRFIIKKACKVGRFNYFRYGTARIAVKRKSIIENTIYFNQCFGGGTEHGSGEDTLFLTACLNSGLKMYAVPYFLAELKEIRPSTWFHGYDRKFFIDKGCGFKAISKKWWRLLCIQDAVRHRKMYNRKVCDIYKMMVNRDCN